MVFGVYPNSGAIYVKAAGKAVKGEHTVTVYARDHGSPVLETSVNVVVVVGEGTPDGRPSAAGGVAFDRNGYVFSLREGVALASLVGQVSAVGPSGLTYRIRTPTDTFAIDSASGTFTVLHRLCALPKKFQIFRKLSSTAYQINSSLARIPVRNAFRKCFLALGSRFENAKLLFQKFLSFLWHKCRFFSDLFVTKTTRNLS